jgi:hypothetical protein
LQKHQKPNHIATASIKKPIHNVKEARLRMPYRQTPKGSANRYSSSLEISKSMVELIGIEPMT